MFADSNSNGTVYPTAYFFLFLLLFWIVIVLHERRTRLESLFILKERYRIFAIIAMEFTIYNTKLTMNVFLLTL